MALILIKDDQGKEHLVHTSIFDSHRSLKLLGNWQDVWKKVDTQAAKDSECPFPHIKY